MRFGLDIAVLAVIVIFALVGAKKGFIKSLIDFLGAFVAMIAAGILSLPAAQWVYDTFFHEALTEKVTSTVAAQPLEKHSFEINKISPFSSITTLCAAIT